MNINNFILMFGTSIFILFGVSILLVFYFFIMIKLKKKYLRIIITIFLILVLLGIFIVLESINVLDPYHVFFKDIKMKIDRDDVAKEYAKEYLDNNCSEYTAIKLYSKDYLKKWSGGVIFPATFGEDKDTMEYVFEYYLSNESKCFYFTVWLDTKTNALIYIKDDFKGTNKNNTDQIPNIVRYR